MFVFCMFADIKVYQRIMIYMTIHNYTHVDMHMYVIVYCSPQNLNLRNQRKNQLLNSNSKQLKTEQH